MAERLEQIDESALRALGVEAAFLLCRLDFRALAIRFGYALTNGRETAKALEMDFKACFADGSSPGYSLGCVSEVTVKYFTANVALIAVVECILKWPDNVSLLLEIVITSKNSNYYACIEDVSSCD